MSLLNLLGDATFYHALERIDAELAEATRCAGCGECQGVLHSARYRRKPRGGPTDLPAGYERRASFCCAVDGCRCRATPPSVRFLGRRVYLGAVVVLVSAMQQGISAFRARRLKELFGVSRETLARWRRWWSTMFATSRFWTSLRGRFVPAVDEATMPASLLSRIVASDEPAVVMLLRLLAPISTRPNLEARAS